MKKTFVLGLMTSSILLSGCGGMGLATGVGAAVGVGAAREGGLRASVTDEAIRLSISDLWFKHDVNMFSKLNLNVNQGRVLITGVVQKPEDRVEAVRLAWQPEGVKQVINEIRVGKGDTLGSYAEDAWISAQLRTKLTFDKYVQSINYSIETVQGTVYLMGVGQDQAELDRTIDIAKKIKGVKEVISYVKLAGHPVIPQGENTYPQENYPAWNANTAPSMTPETTAEPSSNDPVPLSSAVTDYNYNNGQNAGSSHTGIESESLPPQ